MIQEPVSLPSVLTDPALRQNLKWEAFREGIEVSWVYRSHDPSGPATAFLRYAPGAYAPTHEHMGYEHILVLEGEQSDQNGTYKAGSLTVNPPGTQHMVTSKTGCVVLAIWQSPVRFL
jgi:anti-sigma factor ChrR (cupin superfamily)